MANTRELRRRIKSIKNTSQITKAMQMVAATKMRRAQNQAVSGRPYEENLSISVSTLLPKVDTSSHPLLQPNEASATGIVLLSTNKALCGALNTNLFRTILNSHLSGGNVKYFTIGSKGRNFVVRTGKTLEADFESKEVIAFREARQISNLVRNAFLEGLVKEVYLAYPDFISTLKQEPKIVKILPIDSSVILVSEAHPESAQVRDSGQARMTDDGEFLFEPNVNELLDYVLIHHLETQIYQALLETKASEHSARMMAMQNATDNALELVDDLNLTYNQIRQSAITNELLEITTAAAAME